MTATHHHSAMANAHSQMSVILPEARYRGHDIIYHSTHFAVRPSLLNLHMAMGHKPVPPVNIPIPTKIDYNGWCTYPKMVALVLTHSHTGYGPFALPPRFPPSRPGTKKPAASGDRRGSRARSEFGRRRRCGSAKGKAPAPTGNSASPVWWCCE